MVIILRIPHTFNTRKHAVLTYRNTKCSVEFNCRKYHCSIASLMRWNKKYDGNDESLLDKSHRPYSKHPNSHTDEEITKNQESCETKSKYRFKRTFYQITYGNWLFTPLY